jgi:hypothetical protein
MPHAHVHQRYSTQLVDVQPYGNTISIEADSDNPFEDDRDVEVVTQESGGMAGPDPRMRSARVMHKGTAVKAKPLPAGHARVYKTRGAANRQGFMPGFGGFGVDIPVDDSDSGGGGATPVDTTDFAALTAAQDASYLPTTVTPSGILPLSAGPAATAPAAAPGSSGGSSSAGAMAALQAALKAGTQVTTAALAAKTANQAAKAKLPPVKALTADVKTYWPYLAAGVGAVVVLGLLFGGGGRSSTVVMSAPAPAKTNPRTRRR